MTLLTTAELRTHIETDLPDAALQLLATEAENEIIRLAGPHTGEVTEIFEGYGARYLFPSRPLSAISAITETHGNLDPIDLESNDYRLLRGGMQIERLWDGANPGSFWWGAVSVTGTVIPNTDQRKVAQIGLVRLEVQHNGVQSEGIGDYRSVSADLLRERARLLRSIMPRHGVGVA